MRPDTPIVYQGVDSFKGTGSLAQRLNTNSPMEKTILLYQLTLGRLPTPTEVTLGLIYTTEHSWQDYA